VTITESFRVERIPPADEALRPLVRAFLAKNMAGRASAENALSWSGFDADLSRALGAAGLIGLTFPARYGGQDRSQFARFVVVEELLAAGAPVAAHWIGERQSGPLILRYGNEDQKKAFLPRICRGEAFFCIGMSEPDAGSDLAAVRSRAVRDGDAWVLNGAKIWTTIGAQANYVIALVRTSGTIADRHAGLSQVIIDLTAPGVTRRPILDATGKAHFAEIVFEDVRLPADAVLGVEGNGWNQVVAELAFERSGPERYCSTLALLDRWFAFVGTTADSERDYVAAGRFAGRIAVLRAMALAVTGALERGGSPIVEAAMTKDLGTSFEQESIALLGDILAHPNRNVPDDLLSALDMLGRLGPAFSLRGGTREILRGVIARGLALR
jgi:alkylation response protein AidB-like acyl-CoA dehydrogenase